MSAPDFAQLESRVEHAVTRIRELREQQQRLGDQVQSLQDRVARLQSHRREDAIRLRRLSLLEAERNAVRERLTALVDALELRRDDD